MQPFCCCWDCNTVQLTTLYVLLGDEEERRSAQEDRSVRTADTERCHRLSRLAIKVAQLRRATGTEPAWRVVSVLLLLRIMMRDDVCLKKITGKHAIYNQGRF